MATSTEDIEAQLLGAILRAAAQGDGSEGVIDRKSVV
jgi:hypothetical protein